MQPTSNRGSEMTGQRTNNPGAGNASHADEGFLSGMASTVKEKVGDVASSVASTAEDAWDSTQKGVRRAASAVADTAENAWGEFTGLMRRYPFGTLCVGIGLGFLLSRLLETRGVSRFGSGLADRARDYASDVAAKFHS
jgi:hypothetical protein